MNITRVGDVGLLHQGVEHLDDRGAVHPVVQFIGCVCRRLLLLLLGHIIRHFLSGNVCVILFDRVVDGGRRGKHKADIHTGSHLDILDRIHVAGVAHGDDQLVFVDLVRDDGMFTGNFFRNTLDDVCVGDVDGALEELHVHTFRQSGKDVHFGSDVKRDQNLRQTFGRILDLHVPCLLEVVRLDKAFLQKYLSKCKFAHNASEKVFYTSDSISHARKKVNSKEFASEYPLCQGYF